MGIIEQIAKEYDIALMDLYYYDCAYEMEDCNEMESCMKLFVSQRRDKLKELIKKLDK